MPNKDHAHTGKRMNSWAACDARAMRARNLRDVEGSEGAREKREDVWSRYAFVRVEQIKWPWVWSPAGEAT